MLWLGFVWNTSFANKIKVNDDIKTMDDCLSLRNNDMNDNIESNINIKRNNNLGIANNKYNKDYYLINYYQNHISFIKNMDNKYPYLESEILKYHKSFNKWFLELKENKKISKETINKTNKYLKNLYLKIKQYE